jgi:Uma2 family endonuclease
MVKLEKIKTVEAYLAFERASFEKNEFLSFQILTRPTKNRIQNLIGGNLFALIWLHLRKSINDVFQNDMRTHNPINRSFMYPDVVVSDGKPIFRDNEMDNLMNPLLIIEVLSSTTAIYDKTDKFIAC